MPVETAPVKHVFVDIVGFTRDRSVEAQTDIIDALNTSVREVLNELSISSEDTILIPTGDGLCITLVAVERPYDIHIAIATSLIAKVSQYSSTAAPMRSFSVRIGINENIDNLVVDVNSRRNVAGAGISIASRVMDFADADQILVSDTVYERLRHREQYMNAFREFKAPPTKHGLRLLVYQYLAPNLGLSCQIPHLLDELQPGRNLSQTIAFYLAHALNNKAMLLAAKTQGTAATMLLWYLAIDSTEGANSNYTEQVARKVLGASDASFEERLALYQGLPHAITRDLCSEIILRHLSPYAECFDERGLALGARFVSARGAQRLRQEWPKIWSEFGLSEDQTA